jgi:hypothetical protein
MRSHEKLTVLRDAPSASVLAWIHRAEARAIVRELALHGRDAALETYREHAPPADRAGGLLLRLSDPVMRAAARALTAVVGPPTATPLTLAPFSYSTAAARSRLFCSIMLPRRR